MDIFLMFWFVVEGVVFILSFASFRKKIGTKPSKVWRRVLYVKKSKMDYVSNIFLEIVIWFAIGGIVYAIFMLVLSESTVLEILKNSHGLLGATILPTLIEKMLSDEKKSQSNFDRFIILLITVSIGVIAYCCEYKYSWIEDAYEMWILLLALTIAAFIEFLIKKITGFNGVQINVDCNKLRKDLYYRSSRINVDASEVELAKLCENLFSQFMRKYLKLHNLCRIEFVNIYGMYKDNWYNRAAKIMKKIIIASVCVLILYIIFLPSVKIIFLSFLIVAFLLNIEKLKKIDSTYLYRLAIRYFYDEWGYCLYYQDKCKFVGMTQLLKLSKEHSLIYALLDIAALCRYVCVTDKSKIHIVTENICELIYQYGEEMHPVENEIAILPLQIAAFFEYVATGQIDKSVKRKLRYYYTDTDKSWRINTFLFSFWVDMTREMPNEQIGSLLIKFTEKICESEMIL